MAKGTPCQDANAVKRLTPDLTAACIADGVGSAPMAEDGARIAVSAFMQYCSMHWKAAAYQLMDDEQPETDNRLSEQTNENGISQCIMDMLEQAFCYSNNEICKSAEKNHCSASDYDTTLTALLLCRGHAWIAHVGDGAVLGLRRDGTLQWLTETQHGADGGSVIPLRFGPDVYSLSDAGDGWVSVLLVTDGIYQALRPRDYQKAEDGELAAPAYVPLAYMLTHPRLLLDEPETLDANMADRIAGKSRFLAEAYRALLISLPDSGENDDFTDVVKYQLSVAQNLLASVGDDITAVCLCDEHTPIDLPPSAYFREPPWELLRRRMDEGLYRNENTGETKE